MHLFLYYFGCTEGLTDEWMDKQTGSKSNKRLYKCNFTDISFYKIQGNKCYSQAHH